MSKSKAKQKAAKVAKPKPAKVKKEKKVLTTKLQIIVGLMQREGGATVEDMTKATEWQKHTVRGAIAGAVKKKKGLTVRTSKNEGRETVYKINAAD